MKGVALTNSRGIASADYFRGGAGLGFVMYKLKKASSEFPDGCGRREARTRIECGWGMTGQLVLQADTFRSPVNRGALESHAWGNVMLRCPPCLVLRAISVIVFSAFSLVWRIENTQIYGKRAGLRCLRHLRQRRESGNHGLTLNMVSGLQHASG